MKLFKKIMLSMLIAGCAAISSSNVFAMETAEMIPWMENGNEVTTHQDFTLISNN